MWPLREIEVGNLKKISKKAFFAAIELAAFR